MRRVDLPPRLGLFFLLATLLSGFFVYLGDNHETLAARAEIADSHRTTGRIVAYTVEPAHYQTGGAKNRYTVRRDRYRMQIEFIGVDGRAQHAELEWFNVFDIGGLPIRQSPPWVGGLEELERQPTVQIYQRKSSPTEIRLTAPLDALAEEVEMGWPLLTLSLMIAMILSIIYGTGYRLWRALSE